LIDLVFSCTYKTTYVDYCIILIDCVIELNTHSTQEYWYRRCLPMSQVTHVK